MEKNVHLLYFRFNPFPKKPWFLRVCSTTLLKIPREKERLLVTSNFSFSHSVFYPCGELNAIYIKFEIVVCKLSVLKSLKFVVWERIKDLVYFRDIKFTCLPNHVILHLSKFRTVACDIFKPFPNDKF